MAAEQVKLLGLRRSQFSFRVEVALKLKGVEYEFIEEDMSNKSAELLKYNPLHKLVPVLVHNGKPIAESTLIVQYIDEAFKGPSIMPDHPYDKANARFWAKFIDDKISFAIDKCFFGEGEEQLKAKKELPELLKTLETQLEGKKFFGGDKIGLVDIAASHAGYWLGILEQVMGIEQTVTKDKFFKLTEWKDNFAACSPAKECLPPKHFLLEFFRAYNFGKPKYEILPYQVNLK